MTRFSRAIVEGPLLRGTLGLAWPAVLQNVLLGLQGLVSHIVAGRVVGYTANAAIGAGWQVFLVVLVFFSALYAGMAVVVARAAGAGDANRVNAVAYQGVLASLWLGLLVIPFGYYLAPPLLSLLQVTEEVQVQAVPYLRIMFVFGLGNMLVFMLGGVMRAAGDARTPFLLAVLLTVLNIVLNVLLIPGLGPLPAFGAAGAALGTVIAGWVVAAAAVAVIISGRSAVSLPARMSVIPDWQTLRILLQFGLPVGLQGIATALSGVMLVGFVGSLEHGAAAQAAYAVGNTQLFSLVTWTGLGLMSAVSVMAGQNLGAGRPERAIASARLGAVAGATLSMLIGALFIGVPHVLLAMFGLTDAIVVALGTELLQYLGVAAAFCSVGLIYTGALQGAGDTTAPLGIAVISMLALPLIICSTLHYTRGLRPADVWMSIVLAHATRCALAMLRFKQGRWQNIPVLPQPNAAALR